MTIRTESVPCVNCGAASDSSADSFTAIDRLHGTPGTYRYERCVECGLLYASPRVRPEDAAQLYPESYGPHLDTSRRRRRGVTVAVGKWLRRQVIDRIRGLRLPRWVRRRLTPESRVLDVGCGAGEFLVQMKEDYGCDVLGVDMSAAAAATAGTLGVEVRQGFLENLQLPAARFSLITAWYYLEHVPNPTEVLTEMARLLAPGGTIVLSVPNSASVNARVFRDRWYHLDCPRHYHLWTPSTLAHTAASAGLEVVQTRYDRSAWGLLGSLQYALLGDNLDESASDRLRGNRVLGLALLPLTALVALIGGADAMIVYCRNASPVEDEA